MAQLTIISHGDAAAVVLPKAMLESIGLSVGDAIDVTLGDRLLILQSSEDAARRRLMADLTREVLDRRSDAYQRLA
jgi:antitoxin component of MazEF toxin-antitoxin module